MFFFKLNLPFVLNVFKGTMHNSGIRVFIADDHEIARLGLKFYLNSESDFILVGEASNGLEAYNKIVALRPDVAILDIVMPKINGFELCGKLSNVEFKPRIVLITAVEEFVNFANIWDYDIDALLLKDIHHQEFISSLRKVLKGEKVFARQILQYFSTNKKIPNIDYIPNDFYSFTSIQYEILRRRFKGQLFPEIARDLNYSNEQIAIVFSQILSIIPEYFPLENFNFIKYISGYVVCNTI